MKIKKLLTFSLLAICLLTIPVLLSACEIENPTDKPYIQSQGSAIFLEGTVYKYVTIVNPTDKTFIVQLSGAYTYYVGRYWDIQTGKWHEGTKQTGSLSDTVEIDPNCTKKF
jgi:hypothetical protein